MLGPIVVSSIFTSYGPQIAWIAEIGVIASTLALWLIFYRRMVPLPLKREIYAEIDEGFDECGMNTPMICKGNLHRNYRSIASINSL